MRYVSTRGVAPELGFGDVLLAGLARDGGLYVPAWWPTLGADQMARFADAPYAVVATEVMAPYVAGTLEPDELAELVADAYATFDHPDVTPLVDLGDDVWLMELFHGPTLAFKDVAMQLLGRLFDHELSRRSERVTIVGATSGDTGSAAIEACRDRDAIDVFIMHPAGRTSDVQRRQMTTVDAPNIHNIAIEGTFDDCQDLVKALFADEGFRDTNHLSAVNSINWARVMAQIVYYVVASARLGRGVAPVAFSVPTGNFGNVFAGHAAMRMGMPISQLVIGSNRNDILPRWLETGELVQHGVHPTLSPSMDIQISSNHERLLFELLGRRGSAVAELMTEFRAEGRAAVPSDVMGLVREVWSATSLDDDETVAQIRATHAATGLVLDPHSAVGVGAAGRCRLDPAVPMVCLATAHPAKFPDAVERAIGERPVLPERLADLFERPERFTVLPNDLGTVRSHIVETLA